MISLSEDCTTMIDDTGNVYRGQYADDGITPHGAGVSISAAGDIMMGIFNNGDPTIHMAILLRSGQLHVGHTLHTLDGHVAMALSARNEWFHEMRECRGTDQVACTEFHDDLPNGVGQAISSKGSMFQGEFRNGIKHGPGRYLDSNGEVSVGSFHENFMSGQFTTISPDGKIVCGLFEDGKPIRRTCTLLHIPRMPPLSFVSPCVRFVFRRWQMWRADRLMHDLLVTDSNAVGSTRKARARRKRRSKKPYRSDGLPVTSPVVENGEIANAALGIDDTGTNDCGVCVICMDATSTHVVVPCGHVCLCETCAALDHDRSCPFCRAEITSIIRIFLV